MSCESWLRSADGTVLWTKSDTTEKKIQKICSKTSKSILHCSGWNTLYWLGWVPRSGRSTGCGSHRCRGREGTLDVCLDPPGPEGPLGLVILGLFVQHDGQQADSLLSWIMESSMPGLMPKFMSSMAARKSLSTSSLSVLCVSFFNLISEPLMSRRLFTMVVLNWLAEKEELILSWHEWSADVWRHQLLYCTNLSMVGQERHRTFWN